MKQKYSTVIKQAEEFCKSEERLPALLANVSALIFTLPEIFWAGFYLVEKGKLVLQCFCGLPACSQIEFGKGVCGTAAKTGEVQIVPNVHEFSGHIACNSQSNSEIVLPLFVYGKIFGVLDLDSTEYGRFDETDAENLSVIVRAVEKAAERINGENQ